MNAITIKQQIMPTILLVEDEAIIQTVHSNMLKKIGYQVDIASNAKEVISKERNQYPLIFMDIGLPDISGIELTKKLRETNNPQKNTPIVFLTAYSDLTLIKKCLSVGANEVYRKPITILILQDILKKYCQ